MFCLCVYLLTACVPDAHGNQKRVPGPLELDLQMDVGAGTQTLQEQQLLLTAEPSHQLQIF